MSPDPDEETAPSSEPRITPCLACETLVSVPLRGQLTDLGVQLLDRASPVRLVVIANPGVEGAYCLFQQLPLAYENLIRMGLLVTLRRVVTVACSRSASKAIRVFTAASIFRLSTGRDLPAS